MRECPNFEREQIVSARLVGASLIKTATLLGILRAAVSKVMSAYTNRGKTISVKRNSGRKSTYKKRMSYNDKDCFRKSDNY
jgi:biotin operon repressor